MEKQKTPFDNLTSSQLNTYQQMFSIFDKQDSGSIPISSVPMFCRGMGHCPTQAQVAKMLQDLGHPKQKQVSFKKLVNILEQRPKQQSIQQQLFSALLNQQTILAPLEVGKNELMPISLFKKQLAQYGQPFSQAELQAFTEFINTTHGLKFNDSQFYFRNLSKILAYGYLDA